MKTTSQPRPPVPIENFHPLPQYIMALVAPLILMAYFPPLGTPSDLQVTSLLGASSRILLLRNAMPNISAEDAPPLTVEAEITAQEYCLRNNNTYDIAFKIRMRFVNKNEKKVIVDKNIGHGDYQILIATNEKNLSARKYEYETNYDWADLVVSPETRKQFETPGSNFAILAPGESLQVEREFWAYLVAGNLTGSNHSRGALGPGNYLLAVVIRTWIYHTNPEEIKKQWQNLGDLIYEGISIRALPFSLPRTQRVVPCSPNPQGRP